MNTAPEPDPKPPADDKLPPWWLNLHMRAYAELPDTDLKNALDYIDKLRRERDRLIAQLTAVRDVRSTPGPVLLDRVEAVLGYLSARLGDDMSAETAALVREVTGRISGRVS